MLSNKEIRKKAREILSKNHWPLIGVADLNAIIGGSSIAISEVQSVSPVSIPGVPPFIPAGPMEAGVNEYYLKTVREEKRPVFKTIFNGFPKFGKYLGTYMYRVLFTFLWTLCFIVPGIIKAISYSQTMFYATDKEDSNYLSSIESSKKMMHGYKGRYFCMWCSFIGWGLLSILTFGIVYFLHVSAYTKLAYTIFYIELSKEQSGVQEAAVTEVKEEVKEIEIKSEEVIETKQEDKK